MIHHIGKLNFVCKKISWQRYIVLCFTSIVLTGCASLGAQQSYDSQLETDTKETVAEIIAKGDASLRAGDADSAQVSYALAVEREPKNTEALYKLGYVHSKKNSLSVAESLLRHALIVDPSNQASRQLLGEVLLQLERFNDAQQAFDSVLAQDSNAWEALNGLGVISDLQARHPQAQEYFIKALNLQPRSAKVTNNLGYSHYLAGNFHIAETHFLDAIELDGSYNRAWSNLALVYSLNGRVRDASAAFRRIVSEHQAANNLGYLGVLQGNRGLARDQLNRAISTAPSYYELANQNLEKLMENRPSLLDSKRRSSDHGSKDPQSALVNESPIVQVLSAPIPPSDRNPHRRSGMPTTLIQEFLEFIGFSVGHIDGKSGQQTRSAVRDFQRQYGLVADGKVGASTGRILVRETVKLAQATLQSIGYEPGVVNGVLNSQTKTAIRQFQRKLGRSETGELDGMLLIALEKARERVKDEINSTGVIDLSSRG